MFNAISDDKIRNKLCLIALKTIGSHKLYSFPHDEAIFNIAHTIFITVRNKR